MNKTLQIVIPIAILAFICLVVAILIIENHFFRGRNGESRSWLRMVFLHLQVQSPPPVTQVREFDYNFVTPINWESEWCHIWFELLETSVEVVELHCGHRYHLCCIDQYLRKAQVPACPDCKTYIPPTNDEGFNIV